mmetsp:Transcript_17520/g.51248  ORF Transcript_17520/g.51248 Transcript_17520/m.51248 type:complete len:228 (-) Transcript_17520:1545-2228(-)
MATATGFSAGRGPKFPRKVTAMMFAGRSQAWWPPNATATASTAGIASRAARTSSAVAVALTGGDTWPKKRRAKAPPSLGAAGSDTVSWRLASLAWSSWWPLPGAVGGRRGWSRGTQRRPLTSSRAGEVATTLDPGWTSPLMSRSSSGRSPESSSSRYGSTAWKVTSTSFDPSSVQREASPSLYSTVTSTTPSNASRCRSTARGDAPASRRTEDGEVERVTFTFPLAA